MRKNTFYKIYRRLGGVRDIPRISHHFKVQEDVLYSILSQKIVRQTKKDFHVIARQSERMAREWESGKTLLKIAEEREFPPVLTASFILKQLGVSKKQYKAYLHDPGLIKNTRMRKEFEEVIGNDFIYSPQGISAQKERGNFCEEQIQSWLDDVCISYMTENDCRMAGKEKTPDFLFDCPQVIGGITVNWCESKGSFGSPYQMGYDFNNQLKHYLELFGPGMVSYWVGYVDEVSLGDEIAIVDRSFFIDTY